MELTKRLTELAQFMNWEIEPLPLLVWVREHYQYLHEEFKDDTEHYYTDAPFTGEYFRVERGKAAFYALHQQEILNMTYYEKIKLAAEDYFKAYKISRDRVLAQKAYHLMEFIALTATEQDARIEASLQAARYGIEAHEWRAVYNIVQHPVKYGFVEHKYREELESLGRLASREIKHGEKYGS